VTEAAVAGPKRSRTEVALRWIGAITAVLSLLFAVQKLIQTVGEDNERQRRVAEYSEVASLQRQAGDFAAAWESSDAALEAAESGGTFAKLFRRVDEQTQEIREQREDLAMEWLRDARASGDQTFTSLVNEVLPTLDRGVATVEGERKADLLAHIGWAYFLRSRDGGGGGDPQRAYEAALKADARNPFAHAFLGHWQVWKGGSLEEAQQHFSAALAAEREREFVRTMQLAAWRNRGASADAAYVGVVGAMMQNNENVPADARRLALSTLQRSCSGTGNAELLKLLHEALPDEQLASTYAALTADDGESKREECLARLR
jgi:hypothetical protein